MTSNEFFISCNYCASSIPIQMNFMTFLVGKHLYSGLCNNVNCTQREQFACKLCYEYSFNQQTLGLNRGRPIGIYSKLTTAKKHDKNSDTHKAAMILYDNKNIQIMSNDNDDDYDNNDDDYNANNMTTDRSLDSNMQLENNFDDSSSNINVNVNTHLLSNIFDTNSNSTKYFENENEQKDNGARYLIGNAFELTKEDYEHISLEEVNYFMKLTLLLTQLTEVQQKLLAEILLLTSTSKDSKLSIFGKTRVPTSIQDFNDIFLKKDNSIIKNLPHPVVHRTDDGSHAFISLIDLLANEMADATSFDKFEFETENDNDIKICSTSDEASTVSQCQSAEKLFWEIHESKDEDGIYIMYLWLKEWRDGFDPNTTKSSRNQVWINTFTISPPETDQRGKNTYLMSIAGKSENHSEIDKRYSDEIELLSKVGHKFYHGGQKKIIKVKLGKLITCVDRPERASMFKVGDHTGSYSKFWGYAGSIDGSCSLNHLPSCTSCRYKNLIENNNNNIYTTILRKNSNNCCSDWNVLNSNFTFTAPQNYPTNYDTTIGSPSTPQGREIIIKKPGNKRSIVEMDKQQLPVIEITTGWLKEAIIFAYHNLKTSIDKNKPDSKKYWTKGNLNEYLRTFGISKDIINMVTEAAVNNQPLKPFPATWQDNHAMEKCHYAGMHMLFLGHVKSNYNMLSKWMQNCQLSTMFGKQANKYLESCKKLRAHKYYTPHILSTSTWGTGNWVSENYVFFARTIKFFFTLPAITKSKNMMNEENRNFLMDYKVILRFVSALHAALSRIMSLKKNVCDMNKYIKIYMDCMVEMDTEILKTVKINNNIIMNDLTNEVDDNTYPTGIQNKSNKSKVNNKTKKQKFPNYTKSNSLGILSVARSHNTFGPLLLNWEGGYSGERKIQEIKPLLGIKRVNADWEKISLTKYYQLKTINKIMESAQASIAPTVKKSRGTEGLLKIYLNKTLAETAVLECEPLSAVLDHEDRVYVAYRPNDKTSRSAFSLLEIVFDDLNGEEIAGICWMSPIKIGEKIVEMKSLADVLIIAKEFCLLMPMLNDEGITYLNNYYAIGHKWSERQASGKFELSTLNNIEIFHDWYPCENTEDEIDTCN